MSRELGTVDHGRLLEAFSAEAQLLGEVAHSASPDSPVPTAPGWTLNELLRHVGTVYWQTLGWIREGRRPEPWRREPLPGQPVADFYAAARTELDTELAAHAPTARTATWWPADPTHGFWRRRMLHETLVHRVDAENAAGTGESTVPDDLASDGVDEALTLYFGHKLTTMGISGTRNGTVGFHTGGHSWIARAGPGETEAWRCSPRDADAADAIVTGSPANVYLWLWGRVPVTMVHTDGDHELSAQTWALLRLATR